MLDEGESAVVMEGHNNPGSAALIVSLVQLMLDAGYRSVDGFLRLFCKEWLCLVCAVAVFIVFLSWSLNIRCRSENSHHSCDCWPELFCFCQAAAALFDCNPRAFGFTKEFFSEFIGGVYRYQLQNSTVQFPSFLSHMKTISDPMKKQLSKKAPVPLRFNQSFYSPWMDYLLSANLVLRSSIELSRQALLADAANSKFVRLTGAVVLPENVNTLSSRVLSLSLPGGSLWSFPDSMASLKSLTSLSITNQRLTTIPSSIFKLSALTTLNVAGNKIAVLPSSMNHFTSLKKFSAPFNSITDLSALFLVPSLEILNLASNQIKDLPMATSKLTGLCELDLASNMLSTVSSLVLPLLKSYAFILFSILLLRALIPFTPDFDRLEVLNLSGNRLVLPPTAFPPRLQVLRFDVLHFVHLSLNGFTVRLFSSHRETCW